MFKKSEILSFCLIIILVLFSAFTAVFAEEQTKSINTQMTCAHKNLFKIPVYIVPAPGVNFTETQDGCADKLRKISLDAVRIRVAYKVLLQEFSKENLKKAGLEMKLKSEFNWNGSPAVLFKVFQKNGTSLIGKWILVIDREDEAWMITGLYDAHDAKCSEEVLAMLKTICWDTGYKSAATSMPLGNIETEGTGLHLAGLTDGALVYTKDGQIPTKSEDGSVFVISRQKGSCVGSEKQSRLAKENLLTIEKGKKLKIISEKNVVINGMSGIELIACTEDEPKDFVYQALLFDYNDSYVLVGITKNDIPDNLEVFHKLAESYKLTL